VVKIATTGSPERSHFDPQDVFHDELRDLSADLNQQLACT